MNYFNLFGSVFYYRNFLNIIVEIYLWNKIVVGNKFYFVIIIEVLLLLK